MTFSSRIYQAISFYMTGCWPVLDATRTGQARNGQNCDSSPTQLWASGSIPFVAKGCLHVPLLNKHKSVVSYIISTKSEWVIWFITPLSPAIRPASRLCPRHRLGLLMFGCSPPHTDPHDLKMISSLKGKGLRCQGGCHLGGASPGSGMGPVNRH